MKNGQISDAVPMELVIADLQISAISDAELEDAFHRVLVEHKDAVASIHGSIEDADVDYRKYLAPFRLSEVEFLLPFLGGVPGNLLLPQPFFTRGLLPRKPLGVGF